MNSGSVHIHLLLHFMKHPCIQIVQLYSLFNLHSALTEKKKRDFFLKVCRLKNKLKHHRVFRPVKSYSLESLVLDELYTGTFCHCSFSRALRGTMASVDGFCRVSTDVQVQDVLKCKLCVFTIYKVTSCDEDD